MVFSGLLFIFIFLPVTLAAYYIVPFRLKNPVLLLCSLIFYAWGEPVYVFLMILNIVFNYLMGMDIGGSSSVIRRRVCFILCIAFDLGLLGFFKYSAFIMENINTIFGLDISYRTVGLPIGISFYTFQVMSYIIDVYRKKIEPQRNPVLLGVYITMFPQLIAGPIVQYADVEKQLSEREISLNKFGEGTEIFITGLAKKVLLANSAGAVFDTLSALPSDQVSVLSAWLIGLSFTFQIYFDFSGYSDMAIGLGKMLGFDLKPNFDYPYISLSATEFWRRWHISLGSWFREYVYIPMGGSYCSSLRHIRNIMTVWLLTGLWHGASWNFVVWGLYYGLLLIFEKYFLVKNGTDDAGVVRSILLHIYTMFAVITGWVIFACPDMGSALSTIAAMFGGGSGVFADSTGLYYLMANAVPGVIMIIGSTPAVKYAADKATERYGACAHILLTVIRIALLLLSVAYLVNDTYNPFLYFRF